MQLKACQRGWFAQTLITSPPIFSHSLSFPFAPSLIGYTYCSVTYSLSLPFYFQLEKTSATTTDCYCCPVCLLVYSSGYVVYEVVSNAGTQSPSTSPTLAPTPSGSLPTTAPSTQSPSSVPTGLPSASVFARVGNLTLNTGENGPRSAVVSGNYAYFG